MSSQLTRTSEKPVGTVLIFDQKRFDLNIADPKKNSVCHHRTSSVEELIKAASEYPNITWDAPIEKIIPTLDIDEKTNKVVRAKIELQFSSLPEFYSKCIPESKFYKIQVNEPSIEIDFEDKAKETLVVMRNFLSTLNLIFSDGTVHTLLKKCGDDRFMLTSKSFKQKEIQGAKTLTLNDFTSKSRSFTVEAESGFKSPTSSPSTSSRSSPSLTARRITSFQQSISAPLLRLEEEYREEKKTK